MAGVDRHEYERVGPLERVPKCRHCGGQWDEPQHRVADIRIPLWAVAWVIWFTALGVWQATLGRWGWVVFDAVMVTGYLAYFAGRSDS